MHFSLQIHLCLRNQLNKQCNKLLKWMQFRFFTFLVLNQAPCIHYFVCGQELDMFCRFSLLSFHASFSRLSKYVVIQGNIVVTCDSYIYVVQISWIKSLT